MSDKIKITKYKIKVNKNRLYCGDKRRPVKIAILSDMHGRPYDDVIKITELCRPDLIAAPGDIIEHKHKGYDLGVNFLAEAAKIAPVFFSCGNHEKTLTKSEIKKLIDSGVHLVDNTYEEIRIGDARIYVGGLPSAQYVERNSKTSDLFYKIKGIGNIPSELLCIDNKSLKAFASADGFKILLCHNPEYYDKFIRKLDIDITCSGHAHGGQIRIFGRGVFAPGQGLFPKYTSGVYENRLVIGCGLANHSFIPRICNPREVVILTLYS